MTTCDETAGTTTKSTATTVIANSTTTIAASSSATATSRATSFRRPLPHWSLLSTTYTPVVDEPTDRSPPGRRHRRRRRRRRLRRRRHSRLRPHASPTDPSPVSPFTRRTSSVVCEGGHTRPGAYRARRRQAAAPDPAPTPPRSGGGRPRRSRTRRWRSPCAWASSSHRHLGGWTTLRREELERDDFEQEL